jgi:hypothetical protein
MNKHLALAHREPDQQRQNHIQPKSYREAALQIRVCQLRMRALQSLAFIRLRIIGLSTVSQASPSQQWCTGEDSNLRSSKERQIYSLLPLTARPPVHSHPTDEHPIREAQSKTLSVPPSTRAFFAKTQPSAHRLPPGKPPARRSMHLEWDHRGGQVRRFKKSAHRPMQPFSGLFSSLPLSGAGEGI